MFPHPVPQISLFASQKEFCHLHKLLSIRAVQQLPQAFVCVPAMILGLAEAAILLLPPRAEENPSPSPLAELLGTT